MFLPVLHFFLVPGLLFAAVGAGAFTLRRGETVTAKNLPCPHCAAKVSFSRDNPSWPLEARCDECGALLSLRRSS